MARINCVRCLHYFVTWEKQRPHGCKAYGFKSPMLPSLIVKKNSGIDCQLFTPKTPAAT